VISAVRWKLALVFLCGAVFVPIGVLLVAHGGVVAVVIGVVSLAFFGPAALLTLAMVVRPPRLLTLDGAGVLVGAALPSLRVSVPWAEIAAVRIYKLDAVPIGPGLKMLGLVPTNPDAALWTQRRLTRLNRRMTGLAMSISGQLLPVPLERVVEEMRRFRPELPLEYGKAKAAGLGRVTRPAQWRRRQRE